MVWLKLPDDFHERPEIAVLDDVEFRSHVEGLLYCARNRTDGGIPRRQAPGNADDLVHQGLWAAFPLHYQILNWQEFFPSRIRLDSMRESDRNRKRTPAESGTLPRARVVPEPEPVPEPEETPPTPLEKGGAVVEKVILVWNKVRGNQPKAFVPRKDLKRARDLQALWTDCDEDETMLRRACGHAALRYGKMADPSFGLWNLARPKNRAQYVDLARNGAPSNGDPLGGWKPPEERT